MDDIRSEGVSTAQEREAQRSVSLRLAALTTSEFARVEPVVQQAAGKPLASCP